MQDAAVECKLCGCSWNTLARGQHCPSCGFSCQCEPPFLQPAIKRSEGKFKQLLERVLRKALT